MIEIDYTDLQKRVRNSYLKNSTDDFKEYKMFCYLGTSFQDRAVQEYITFLIQGIRGFNL